MIENRYMDVPTCAAYLGRTVGAVQKLVERKQIPYIKKCGRVHFDKDRIDRWMTRDAKRAVGTSD